ncbi:MAG TPA: menaquinone biosynthesis protein [Flavihumibacter sp.]
MDRKIRVGAVAYLNTKPLIYGLEKGLMKEEVEVTADYPANVANKLINDEIDVGLVPVATIPRLKEYQIVCDYGIACDGPVASVCMFSDVPMDEIETVLLDYQSRTSVRLARILMKEFWKIDPVLVDTRDDFRGQIKGTTAGIVIGDRALEQRHDSAYVFDLGQAWKEMTGLPFVFAAWISNKKMSPEFRAAFNRANKYGLDRLAEVVAANPYKTYDLFQYYTRDIDYRIDEEKMKGLSLYLKYLDKFDL